MKKLLLTAVISMMTLSAFAADKITSSKGDGFQLLDLVIGIHQTYSNSSNLEAKVIELLAGDGMNASRMVLSLNTGVHEEAKVYELNEMMYSVSRITFLAKDVIVINYIQDSFKDADGMEPVQVNKSLKITVQRDSQGQLTDEITVEKLN